MPANAMRQADNYIWEPGIVEPSQQLLNELDACPEVGDTEKEKVKTFLAEMRIRSVTEMDYPLRQIFKDYLEHGQHIRKLERYMLAYDRIKQYSIRKQMGTLAGRTQCRWQMGDKVLFIPYHPNQELALEFDSVRNRPYMVWDFARPCSRTLKHQVFTSLNAVMEQCKELRRREQRLSGLRLLYDFCVEKGIGDIEKLEISQIRDFDIWLDGRVSSARRKQDIWPILNFCRRVMFLQSEEIHWEANVWYLERLMLTENRINPSSSVESISFAEISRPDNRRYAQEYMKYQLGITGQAVSTIVTHYKEIRNFLVWLCERNCGVCDCTEEQIDTYLNQIQQRDITAKTFNVYLVGIHHFFRFLVVKGYIRKVPFHPEYHTKKIIPKHHDRSVSLEICMELLSKLYLLPEHLRCMYLHLWCLGLRISEVCSLKGNAYYRQGQDPWIQVYQVKMKTYKRIPIAEGLYRVMEVYIDKNRIGPDDYLFANRNGGAYISATFRCQMKKFCQENQLEGGEYLFRSHDYRHTVATFFYDNGVSLQSVRDYLGHDCEEMTEQYLDYWPGRIAKANDTFFEEQGNSLAAYLKKKGGKDGG